MRKVGIMQPYFLPYIGYFQLINAVDVFVLYDNIEYTKKGWINRNRILVNGKDEYISLPLTKSSDYLHVIEKELSADFQQQSQKLIRKIEGCYKKAPNFTEAFLLFKEITHYPSTNLFDYIYHSLKQILNYLEINTELVISSGIDINHELKGKDKVIEIVKKMNGTVYINPIGGVDLYDKKEFGLNNIELHFIKAKNIKYNQFGNEFVPFLSIIDVLMFNPKEKVIKFLHDYELS